MVRSKVIVAAPLAKITVGENVLLIAGGIVTVSVPTPAVPMPALVVVILPVLFTLLPGVVEVTGITIEQLPEDEIVPSDNVKKLPPLAIVTVPPQVFVVGLPAVFVMPDG